MEIPHFQLQGDLFKVTLKGPGERFMESAKKAEEIESIPGLNERQKQAIRYLQEAQRISPKEYIELTGASESTAFRDLRDLVDRGILWGFGKTRDRHYRLVDRE